MHYPEEDEPREMMDVPCDEPIGHVPVSFNVPIPTMEQVAGEIARQIIASQPYGERNAIMAKALDCLNETVHKAIAAKAAPIIEELLAKPLQPTDGFGNPIGEPTSLQGLIASRVTSWCNDMVDSNGHPKKPTAYDKSATNMEWMLGKMTNAEMRKAVDAEVARIVQQLKQAATSSIAKQIAEKVSGMVLK